jgi:hypothetical protein
MRHVWKRFVLTLSSLFRNVLFLASLEMTLFLLMLQNWRTGVLALLQVGRQSKRGTAGESSVECGLQETTFAR